MQLLMFTDYALRVLLYVGWHQGAAAPSATIAGAYGISVDHIAKVAKALTRNGLLRATRGVGGGVRLAKPASEIRVGDVVRLFEEKRGPVECLREGSGQRCAIDPACRLKQLFASAELAFYRELDAYTLADLLGGGPALVSLSKATARAHASTRSS